MERWSVFADFQVFMSHVFGLNPVLGCGVRGEGLCWCCAQLCVGGLAARRENSEPPPIGGD